MVFERNSRGTLRAWNIIESVLQTWKARDDSDFLLAQFCISITRAVKCALQAQVASLCVSIKLRREHHHSIEKAFRRTTFNYYVTHRCWGFLGCFRIRHCLTLTTSSQRVLRGKLFFNRQLRNLVIKRSRSRSCHSPLTLLARSG